MCVCVCVKLGFPFVWGERLPGFVLDLHNDLSYFTLGPCPGLCLVRSLQVLVRSGHFGSLSGLVTSGPVILTPSFALRRSAFARRVLCPLLAFSCEFAQHDTSYTGTCLSLDFHVRSCAIPFSSRISIPPTRFGFQ